MVSWRGSLAWEHVHAEHSGLSRYSEDQDQSTIWKINYLEKMRLRGHVSPWPLPPGIPPLHTARYPPVPGHKALERLSKRSPGQPGRTPGWRLVPRDWGTRCSIWKASQEPRWSVGNFTATTACTERTVPPALGAWEGQGSLQGRNDFGCWNWIFFYPQSDRDKSVTGLQHAGWQLSQSQHIFHFGKGKFSCRVFCNIFN